MSLIPRYAAWCRRQARTASCGHVVIGGIAVVVFAAWCAAQLIARFHVVLLQGTCAAAAAAAAALAARYALRRRPRAPWCHDCGAARADGVVRFANGVRGDEVPLCRGCFEAGQAAARPAAADPVADLADEAAWLHAELSRAPAGFDPAAEAAALRGELPAAPDNAPAADERTQAELARVLEQSVRWPERGWTRGHP